MKKINKFGIWALALVALAGLFPQTAAASGSIRSITAYDPETGHRDYGPNDLIRIGETLAFRVRLLNYNPDCTSTGGFNNPWSFRLRTGVDSAFALANLPKMGLWISGHKRLATYKSIGLSEDGFYTDIVFEYKVQSGDLALPVKFCDASGTTELLNSEGQQYLLENVGPLSAWELKDESTGTTCEFSFGAQNLLPSSTDKFEYPPAGWSSAYEVRDYDLSQASIYVQTVDFDSADDPWRTVYENKTTTVEGALPTLFIPGGASDDSTVYLWTESTNVAYLASGGERIYHSLDHERQPKDYLVYAANIVHATNFTFKVRGAHGAAGQTTTIYLSATPTNIYNRSGTLITNFVSRTIAVTNQANPEIVFTFEPASISCDSTYSTHPALLHVTVDAFTNAIDVALNPTLGISGPALPVGVLGLSESADDELTFLDTLHFPKRNSLDDLPLEKTYYVFGLGFATNDVLKQTSQTVVFSPTVTGDGGKYNAIAPVTLAVKEEAPVIDLVNVTGGEIDAVSDEDYPIVLTVADSYANMHDTTRGYEIWWKSTASSQWALLKAGVPANSDGELNFSINYSSGGTKTTSIRVLGPDGIKSAEVSFTANVASAKGATLCVDKDSDDEYPRVYNEGDIVKKIRIELQNWKNEETTPIYAFLEPLNGTENYITAAKFLTTTAGATGLEIKRDATNTTAAAQFTTLDGFADPGLNLEFNIVLRDKKNWSDAGARTLKTFPADSITVNNVEPRFTSVTMNGGTRMTVGDGSEKQETAKTLEKTFTWKIYDVAADLSGMTTVWRVYAPGSSALLDEKTFVGDPATPLSYTYKFDLEGRHLVTVQMRDKDMTEVLEDNWPTFSFNVDVGPAPQTMFALEDGTEDKDDSLRHHFNETAEIYPVDNYFKVGLSSPADDDIVVKVTATPLAASDPGKFVMGGAEADGAVYVTIPKKTQGAVARINLLTLDGTRGSADDNKGGFLVTATVTNENPNADGMAYNEVYKAHAMHVYVDNVAPVLKIWPDPGSKSSTNDYYEATGVSVNEPLEIEWDTTDVSSDLITVSQRWSGLPSDPNAVEWLEGSRTSPAGKVRFWFSKSGTKEVSLTITDKDKDASNTVRVRYEIAPSKDVFVTPLRPSRSGQSQTSKSYVNADGYGEGHVYVERAEKCTGVQSYRQSWSCSVNASEVFLWGFGYNVGDVDDGSLAPAGFDWPIDPNGNNMGTISTYYKYNDATRDSFLYAWIFNVADEQGGWTGTAYAKPQVGKTDYEQYMKAMLPTEAQGDEDNPYYQSLTLEAVFAREPRPAANVGDITAAGIPDVYAVTKRWDGGYLYQLAEGGGGGGEGEGSIGGGDLKHLDGLNTDEDYLPAPTTGGNVLIPNVVANWATTGEKFKAYYEIRGFHEGLNYRDERGDGVNYNVRGKWISDPDFSTAEAAAYLRYCASKLGNDDPAVIALAEAACTAAGGDPTDPEQLAPYLDPAREEYANSDEFKAAVYQPDYLDKVEWSPENRTDPTMEDTDDDGLPDGYEYYFWYRALVGDTKGVQMVGSRFNPDNIAQGIEITSAEIATNFNPTVKALDNVLQRDTDGDGLTDLEELAMGTNPVHWDTDGDGMSDLYEVMWNLQPLKTFVEEPSQRNPDGDFMASWTSGKTWAIITVPGKGVYAVDESVAMLDGFVPGEKENEGTLDPAVQDQFEGLPMFWYGADNSTAVPKIRSAQAGKTLLTSTESVDVSGVTEPITVARNKPIRLIHDQVYTQFGFDPRTGWGIVPPNNYVATRWDHINNLVTAEEDFNAGDAGLATNTVAFTSLDEYLLGKYAMETGAPIAAYEIKKFESWMEQHGNTRRDVVELVWSYCTCPNMPFDGVQYGDGTMTFGSEIYGADTDGDGVPDGWELYVNIPDGKIAYSPLLPEAGVREDDDALRYSDEYAGTDSCNVYSNTPSIYANHPGNNTGWYNKFFPTDPHNEDTDGDGVSDSDEGRSWKGTFFAGRKGGETESFETEFTFIYGPNEGKPEGDDGSRCIRGGGLNPCAVDTDGDLLPDGWERQFAGIVFGLEGLPSSTSLSADVVRQFRVSDGLESLSGETLATPVGFYITGGQDGTYGPSADRGKKQPGDASTLKGSSSIEGSVDPRTGTVRNCDWDHDGLQNFQEYLVQTLRHLRYDDCETPLMGSYLFAGGLRFVKCLPFQAFDGTAFYETCRKAGFQATSAWKYRELGYFARPPHEWDPLALNTNGYDPLTDTGDCINYKDYEGPGYRILLPPQGLAYGASVGSERRAKAVGYVSTDPRRWDSDDDGLDDFWEIFHGLNPLLGKAELIQDGVMNIANDVIAGQYGGVPNSWINGWTGWPMFPSQPPFDAMKYPWMIGTPECDADGDGLRNVEEGLFVNITAPSPTHTDPTPLWMTDSTSPKSASYTAQYYRADPYADSDNIGLADIFHYPTWAWGLTDALGAGEGLAINWMFSFEENEGYDTDNDRAKDSSELVTTVENASDPLKFTDPDHRQALYLPGWHTSEMTGTDIGSAVVSRGGADTMQKPISSCFDMLRQFTVEVWIKPERLNAEHEQVILERVANYGPSTLANGMPVIRANFRLGLRTDNHIFAECEGSTADSSTARLVGPELKQEWTHVAFTYDGSTFALYVNDATSSDEVPVASAENNALIPANGITIIKQEVGQMAGSGITIGNTTYATVPCALVLGASARTANALTLSKYTEWGLNPDEAGQDTPDNPAAFGRFFTGWLDEVRVWDGARTGAEIAADFRKRYSFDDVKAQRQTVYDSWENGATRNGNRGMVLPVELLQHYNFCTLPGATDAGVVAIEPTDFSDKVLGNVRIAGGTEEVLGVGGLNCGWWYNLPVHSEVYYDYHTVPWVQNTCAHLPFMDGSTPDSMYWCENFGGLTPASTASAFPNTANPYSFYNYLADRAAHLKRLERFAEGEDSPYAAFENLYTFQLRAGFVGTSDLVPLGGAFAKRSEALWDGKVADAWTQTGDDANANELPDWWEDYFFGAGAEVYKKSDGTAFTRDDFPEGLSPTARVWRNGVEMTIGQAYRYDLAEGMMYSPTAAEGYEKNDDFAITGDKAKFATDENGNGIPDWWEKLYGIYGESVVADHDNDQLSNFSEYLIGECFKRASDNGVEPGDFMTLLPTEQRSYHNDPQKLQMVPDYFLTVGQLYYGELFTDHDFMEDWWEVGNNDPSYTSRFSYDVLKDADWDGWSNFAECRHALWKASMQPDLVDGWVSGDFHLMFHPDPIIGVKLAYHGNQDVVNDSKQLVVRVSSCEAKVIDAVFKVACPLTKESSSLEVFEADAGIYREGAIVHGHLSPGRIQPGSEKFLFVSLSADMTYRWRIKDDGNQTYPYGVWIYDSEGYKYYEGPSSEYIRAKKAFDDKVDLVRAEVVWTEFTKARQIGNDGMYGEIVHSASGRAIGKINYRTGEYELDMGAFRKAHLENDGSEAELLNMVFKAQYSYRIGTEWPQTLYLSNPALGDGYIREGTNVVSAFFDMDGDGKWTAGEPYGAAPMAKVGWWKTTTEIELTDTHPSMARFDLSAALGGTGGSSGSSSLTDRDVNGSQYGNITIASELTNALSLAALRLRVVRTQVNGESPSGKPGFAEVVLDRTINVNQRPLLTEADLVATVAADEPDLDWGKLGEAWSMIRGTSATLAGVSNATYRVVVGNGSTSTYVANDVLPIAFVNAFEPLADQTRTTPLTPQGAIESGQPTFTWRHDNMIGKSYPAFQLKVWREDGTLVYDSGRRKAPPRNSKGEYSWTAPLYADMVTQEGKLFATKSNYKWAVSMLDAKFTEFRRERAGGEVQQTFRLNCSGVSGGLSDYGTIALTVRYFGPGNYSTAATDSRKSIIRVQAFDTPDFTGDPAGEAYVADDADIRSFSDISTVNARIIGLKPGTYYVRAFIDTNGDGVRQDWESWGYANYVGTFEKAIYNPKGLTIASDSVKVPESIIYIEDADTDDDGFPDIYEWDVAGSLDNYNAPSGDTFFTQVNPYLMTMLSAYSDLNLDTGKAMPVASAPVFRMVRAAESPAGLNAVNALLSSTPEVEVESGIAVTIESFSLTDGVSVKVETATTVDGQGLLVLRTEPVSFRLELRHKASLADAGWETVASVPFAVGANETVTLSADDLAVLREKIAEMGASGTSGFFKVVLAQ